MRSKNLDRLIEAASLLRPLLDDLVFVGGIVTALLITDEAAGEPRPTLDVDAVAEITSYAEYAEFGERLRGLQFREDTSEGAPVCRWVHGQTILDLMPLDQKILGFSNRWYRAAVEFAIRKPISADLTIRMVSAPFFVATKMEAFKGRGNEDFLTSRDLEDVVSVVDGREMLIHESRTAPEDLRQYLAEQVRALLARPEFIDALPGYLYPDEAAQRRIGIVMRRLENLASL